jgi:nucleoside-diphosphate-sugar epimerase
MNAMVENTTPKTVMVTGANGFLASYIVKDLLAEGHTIHVCVRDADREASTKHLRALSGASEQGRLKLFSTGNLANASAETQPFDVPMKTCHAVFHAATPLNIKFGVHDGEQDINLPWHLLKNYSNASNATPVLSNAWF